MSDAVRAHYSAFPTPGTDEVAVGPKQLDRIDDNLHYGWAWHRYRYCYRRAEHLRILDAGCGTGLSTLGLALLNAGSTVIGLDFSPPALALAKQRAEAAGLTDRVSFREHDLSERLPAGLGPFDFIVCRDVLGHVSDAVRVLENLARVLDSRGLMTATFPARAGREPIRQFRAAIEALCPPDMDLAARAEIGQMLYRSLRADHPIRRFESRYSGQGVPNVARVISAYLGPEPREWRLDGAIAASERASLKFLYAPTAYPWSADRVFGPAIADELKARVQALGEKEQARLIDALDPAMHLETYRIHLCLPEFEPRTPSWPEDRQAHPETFDRLIPHVTGLARPMDAAPPPSLPSGPAMYVAVTGAAGPIDPLADLMFRAVDGRLTCGEIDKRVQGQSGLLEKPDVRQSRWLDLANHGFIELESTDPRQNIDCVHLGPIRDRLDCACPRRWVRSCERHGFCTIDEVKVGDPQEAALRAATSRLAIDHVVNCTLCPDYVADDHLFLQGD